MNNDDFNSFFERLENQFQELSKNIENILNNNEYEKDSFDSKRRKFIRTKEQNECTFKEIFSDNSESIGGYGEKLTIFELEFLKLKGYDGNIISNVYLPHKDGITSEIDVLFVTKKGIFVIESKNYSGWIFGSQNDKYWTVGGYNNKWKLYNPVLQNQGI